ncbi:MAG: hypothetical protein Fur0025_34720 [Oscillatoriaceae cyanobacterium]
MLGKLWHRWFERPKGHPQPSADGEVNLQAELDEVTIALFLQFLEAAPHGWNEAQLLELLGNLSGLMTLKSWEEWLPKYGSKLLAAPEPDLQIGEQLLNLCQVGCGAVGEIAGDIGRSLFFQQRGGVEETMMPGPEAAAAFSEGNNQAQSGDFAGAIVSFDRAISLDPDFYQAWANRGFALNGLARYAEALASYDEALMIQPNFYPAWLNRGVSLKNLGRYEAALICYDRAIELDATEHLAFANRGFVLFHLQRYQEALASYEQAIAIEPKRAKTWMGRGETLMAMEDYLEAIVSFERALEIKPKMHSAWIERGKCLFLLSRYAEAISSFDKALALQPDDSAINGRQQAIDALKAGEGMF